jgi:ribosome biogenesis GTPase
VEQRGRFGLLGAAAASSVLDPAVLDPALVRRADSRLALPAVGDWVGVQPADASWRIVHVFDRATCFVRRAAGEATAPQVVAANVDTVAIVTALTEDRDWTARARRAASPRRIERYLIAVRQSGAQPIVVLNKADLSGDPRAVLTQLAPTVRGVPLVVLSAATGAGMDELAALAGPGDTLAFVGCSGVGKSTLINRLAGVEMARTTGVRDADQRGRHTTSHRQLHLLPGGALLLDTPGMRELGLWAGADELDEDVAEVFDEVASLAARCRFRDCRHQDEPGCAVRSALSLGQLDAGRVDSFVELQRELRTTKAEAREAKRRWERDIARAARRLRKER